jgi:hypothetical protein
MLGLWGFCTAIAFVNFGYFVYLPTFSGLAIAVSRAAEAEFLSRSQAAPGVGMLSSVFGPSVLSPRAVQMS